MELTVSPLIKPVNVSRDQEKQPLHLTPNQSMAISWEMEECSLTVRQGLKSLRLLAEAVHEEFKHQRILFPLLPLAN